MDDVFENFLMVMDDKLEALKEEAKLHGYELDSTDQSIHCLEDLFDAISKTRDQSECVVSLGRYLGEVMRINHGGKWHMCLEADNSIYFNQPTIKIPEKNGVIFAPLSVVKAYSLRRKRGTIPLAYQSYLKPTVLDIDDLIEES